MRSRYEFPYPPAETRERYPFHRLEFERRSNDAMASRAVDFHAEMDARRSVRMLSDEPVPVRLIELAVTTASTAPSGAHQQPWQFVAVGDPAVKAEIRRAAEEEERINYEEGRMPERWQNELAPLGTDWHKEFLAIAPWIVVLFEERYGIRDDGSKRHHYYVKESCGIAAGMFITALHHMGLATLTHTPSPMAFLSRLLGRPENERPFVLFPVGFPVEDCEVPTLHRKPLGDVLTIL
ncbi:nitroreductase family protein [Ilumatobacter sp.]|uniref:nitroreductase family protein n=1 Tax=Ilumatobacter sp. TaxID=1967498 RepID=UPI003C4182B4